MEENSKTTLKLPISLIVSAIALFICVYNMISINDLKSRIESEDLIQNEVSINDDGRTDVSDQSITIPWPYFNQTQTVSGITATVNDDKSITVTGKATEDNVVFRFISNDKTIEIPLDKKKYVISSGIDPDSFDPFCRIDVGIMKADGTTEVINGAKGDIFIDNTSGKYNGIFGMSIYCKKGFETPENYTFNVQIAEQ